MVIQEYPHHVQFDPETPLKGEYFSFVYITLKCTFVSKGLN